jgi:probable HAF family extracellular repeat protein
MLTQLGAFRTTASTCAWVLPLAAAGLLASTAARADVPPAFYALGHLPGAPASTLTTATGVSGNGVVVGYGYDAASAGHPFRWTAATGLVQLDLLPGATDGYALAVSADGSIVAGYCHTSSGSVPTVWDASGPRAAPLPTGITAATLTACSADGLSLAGYGTMGTTQRAIVWPAAGSAAILPLLAGAGPNAFAYSLSGDGAVAVGFSGVLGSGLHHAYRWTSGAGMVDLGDLAGGTHDTIAYAASADGSVIVGDAGKAVGGREAFRWTPSGGMIGLGAFSLPTGPPFSYGRAVSGDGQIVTGFSTTSNFQEAFVWSADTGLRNVLDVLTTTYGVTVTGWLLAYGQGISPDGTIIVGQGLHFGGTEAWAAVLPRPCYANCDNSTSSPVLDVNDFLCFQTRFAAGDSYANCDHSTQAPVLTVNDFVCFQTRFASGCP